MAESYRSLEMIAVKDWHQDLFGSRQWGFCWAILKINGGFVYLITMDTICTYSLLG